jgi:ATP synthase subunit 6
MLIHSAFDQFELIRLIPFTIGGLDFSITNATLFFFIAWALFWFLWQNNNAEGFIIPTRWQSILELLYNFIFSTVLESMGNEGKRFFPFILTIFSFIAVLNVVGIIPYTFSPTAHFIVTMGLSFSIWFGVLFMSLANYGTLFFSMFLPAGAPMWLAPLLVVIEIISYVAKALSLGVRLGANILAGHLLFAILSGFTFQMLTSGSIGIMIAGLFPLAIVLAITALEMAVALIQAYIFSLLTVIYLNETVDLH